MIEQKETIEVKSLAQPYLVKRGVDYFEYQLPISVKAVISLNGQIPLLRNERDEWELPGGKLDLGESPTACVQREVHEELNIDISVGMNVHNWVYTIFPYRHVFVVTYFAKAVEGATPHFSHEHKELILVSPDEVNKLNMPEGYKVAIRQVLELGLFKQKYYLHSNAHEVRSGLCE